jgi:putative membrane protein
MMPMSYGWILMLLFWIFVVAGTAWLVLTLTRFQSSRGPMDGESARRILQDRLARGEIDIEEFKARRAAMEETRR